MRPLPENKILLCKSTKERGDLNGGEEEIGQEGRWQEEISGQENGQEEIQEEKITCPFT